MKTTRSILAAALLLLAACTPGPSATVTPPAPTAPAAAPASSSATMPTQARVNPLLQASKLPYQYPPFDKIQDTDFRAAFEEGMAAQRKEIEAIAHQSEAPTFDNTIVAMERSGQLLTRTSRIFNNLNASNTNDTMEKVEADMAPKLAAHQDAILLDPALFARVDALYQQRDKLGLDPESAQLLERYERMFLRAGAKLAEQDKATLKKINEELSSLTTQFRQNVLKATKNGAVVVDDVKELDGLSQEQIGAAAEAAKARGLEGKWLITLQNTTIQPPLEQMNNRALRERVFKASMARGVGGPEDTTSLIARIVELRAKKAALLGYPNYASWSLAEETAGTTAAVNKMLGELAPAALAKAKQEAAELQKIIDAEAKAKKAKPFKLQPWDWAYYEAKARKARFDFDDAQVKPYFEMNRVMQDGVFYAAHELYGITFHERKDLPVYHPDVRVFEVREGNGTVIGLLLLDFFKRDNKQGGAWMDNFVDQCTLLDQKPVVTNNLNVPKPAAGQPALLTFDEVTTMFHEFGHALHGLLSASKYPLLSGTNVPRDFVEFPSQFNEMWTRDPKVIAHFAKHYVTGEPIPKALLDKVIASQGFGQGYATLEYVQAAMLDQSWHQLEPGKTPAADKVVSFDDQALAAARVQYPPVPPRYHSTYFSHVFAGGYESAYYAYIWAEVLARDAGAWFNQRGGLTRANGDAFRAGILSRGRTQEPSVLFRTFYGKDPEIQPLLDYRGLSLPGVAKKKP